jgi:adenosylhomocysteine nucleosidase
MASLSAMGQGTFQKYRRSLLRHLRAKRFLMRILVTFAVEAEFAPWRKRHDFRSFEIMEGTEAYLATISGIEVIVGLTGIGPEAAASKTCDFTWGEVLDLCITTGFTGALRPEYQVADVLAAREIVADEKRSQLLGRKVESTKRLLKIAASCGAKVVDRFYSSPSTVRTAEDKAALKDIADAVEMESFEVLSEALAWMTEGIAVRAVSDVADEDLPLDFDQVVTEEGELSMARLAGQIVRKPSVIPALIRLGKRSGEAAKRLADFLDSYIPALASKSEAVVSKVVSAT